ncbi:uncharacterized protein Triagg1_5752 [Trichoderma aggressivum f. europaeum]|uniref:Uncharacterized protein n=1 Tax=Trichoderma aggressivum f. europaeum TaxID=173218 RepID=A0AAE1J5A4_9HYPO|nr:hypothetical protein Triagg1_5752 [Trichoderma aggressivum f. europaeum]
MALLTSQAGTLLGPLTTTWTMPETCSIYLQGFRGQSCNSESGGRVQDNTECWPPAKSGIASPSWPFVGWGFYSPGIACPAGYTTACTAVYGQRAQWSIQFTLVSSETAVGCCPTGFACDNLNGNTCVLTASDTEIPTASCDGTSIIDSGLEEFPHFFTVTDTNTAGTLTHLTFSQSIVLLAPMFQINFQATDLPASTTTAATTLSTATTRTTSSTIQQTSTSAADNSVGKGSSGLSDGAKVGLGVGLGLGAAFLLAFAGFIYYYRRSKRSQIPVSSELPSNEVSEAAETPKVKTLPGQVYEMGDYQAPAELPTRW